MGAPANTGPDSDERAKIFGEISTIYFTRKEAANYKQTITGIGHTVNGLKLDLTAFKADATLLALGLTAIKADYTFLKVDEKGVYWRGRPLKQWGADKDKQSAKNTERAQAALKQKNGEIVRRLRLIENKLSAHGSTKEQLEAARVKKNASGRAYRTSRSDDDLKAAQRDLKEFQRLQSKAQRESDELKKLVKRAEKDKSQLGKLAKEAEKVAKITDKLSHAEKRAKEQKAAAEKYFKEIETKAGNLERKLRSLAAAVG
ncbi:hypothetical protein ACIA8O_35000 [Kitasatospora sp. NPDC051853]|uniref:hypothetical protein n=1 Tax=Kitasatospora sp. NPDC051853 TaxID=3364058 RepID=UPI0037AE87B5